MTFKKAKSASLILGKQGKMEPILTLHRQFQARLRAALILIRKGTFGIQTGY